MIPRSWRKVGWTGRQFATAGVVAALGALVVSDAWADMFHIALRDEESSHAFLVPIVMAWMFWVRRGRFRLCRPDGTWAGPLIVAAGWFCYSFGNAKLMQSVWHGGAILMLVGAVVSVLGKDLLRYFLPVIAAMIFLVPVPGRLRQRIAIPLETATAEVTQTVFELAGEQVTRSGNMLNINGNDVAIAEACNGLRMVFALTLVSYAFAFGSPLRGHTRAIILIASPLSAMLCNVIRLVPTVWLYGYHPGTLADRFHDLSAWLMLGVSFLILMGIIRLLRWALVPVTPYPLAYD